jgi:hypothetical protein
MKIRVVAAAWLLESDWPRWLETCADLQPDRADWLRKIERGIKDFEGRGYRVEKVTIDPERFVEWCRATGVKADRNSRSAYAAILSDKQSDH